MVDNNFMFIYGIAYKDKDNEGQDISEIEQAMIYDIIQHTLSEYGYDFKRQEDLD